MIIFKRKSYYKGYYDMSNWNIRYFMAGFIEKADWSKRETE